MAPAKIRRFYKEAKAASAETGAREFMVLLDGRPVKTPGRRALVLPSLTLAEAVAEEWSAQDAELVPQSMPLTSLCCTALDIVAVRREACEAEIADYGGHDLVCYRAEAPQALVARQADVWQPLVNWAALELDAPLVVTKGIAPVEQPAAATAALSRAVAAHDDLGLSALATAVKATGSLVIGLALSRRRLEPDEAFEAAELDASYQIELWGEDAEASRRRAAIVRELRSADRLFRLCAEAA